MQEWFRFTFIRLFFFIQLIHLLSVTAAFSESRPSSGGLTKHDIARATNHHSLCVTKHGGNLEASGALDIHKETVWTLNKALELVRPGLRLWCGV